VRFPSHSVVGQQRGGYEQHGRGGGQGNHQGLLIHWGAAVRGGRGGCLRGQASTELKGDSDLQVDAPSWHGGSRANASGLHAAPEAAHTELCVVDVRHGGRTPKSLRGRRGSTPTVSLCLSFLLPSRSLPL